MRWRIVYIYSHTWIIYIYTEGNPLTVSEKDLLLKIRELNRRIEELEGALETILDPIRKMEQATRNYYRLLAVAMREGRIGVDLALPDVRDSLSREIVEVLLERKNLNITRITERLRERRGTASRRIVRERLKGLIEDDVVVATSDSTPLYSLSDEVMKKWAQLLGIDI